MFIEHFNTQFFKSRRDEILFNRTTMFFFKDIKHKGTITSKFHVKIKIQGRNYGHGVRTRRNP